MGPTFQSGHGPTQHHTQTTVVASGAGVGPRAALRPSVGVLSSEPQTGYPPAAGSGWHNYGSFRAPAASAVPNVVFREPQVVYRDNCPQRVYYEEDVRVPLPGHSYHYRRGRTYGSAPELVLVAQALYAVCYITWRTVTWPLRVVARALRWAVE